MLHRLLEMGVMRRVMLSTHVESLSVFQSLVEVMNGEGYQHTASHTHSKFKHEKGAFMDCMQAHNGRPPPGIGDHRASSY